MTRGEITHDFSEGKKKEEVTFWFLSLKEAKMDQVELLKEAFMLPGGNVIPACSS